MTQHIRMLSSAELLVEPSLQNIPIQRLQRARLVRYLRLEVVAVAAVLYLRRIGTVSVHIVLFDGGDELLEEATDGGAGRNVGDAKSVCTKAADVIGTLDKDDSRSHREAATKALIPAGVAARLGLDADVGLGFSRHRTQMNADRFAGD